MTGGRSPLKKWNRNHGAENTHTTIGLTSLGKIIFRKSELESKASEAESANLEGGSLEGCR